MPTDQNDVSQVEIKDETHPVAKAIDTFLSRIQDIEESLELFIPIAKEHEQKNRQ